MTYTVAAHNMLFRLSKTPWKWNRDLKKSSKATITVYCEAQRSREVLNKHCKKNNRGLYYPAADPGNPISWDLDRAELIPGKTWLKIAHLDNEDLRATPTRGFSAVGLKIKSSNRKTLVISIHAENGYAKPVAKTSWGRVVNEYKDWSAQQYWLDVLAFVCEQMSTEYWDDIVIAGDFNARMSNKKEWYYPGRMLDNVTRPSLTSGGIDHVITTVTSKSKVVGVLKMKGWTDHPILLARLS